MSFSEANWDELKEEMRAILINQARQRATITYSSLAASMQTVHMHHRAPYFHKLLRDMDADEVRDGRPSLAALVVRKDTGIPGSGFFTEAPFNADEIFDPVVYWQREFDIICDYWGEK